MFRSTASGVILLLFCSCALAQQLVEIVSGLDRPLYITPVPDGSGRLFIVEQRGTIRILDANENLLPGFFLDIRGQVAQQTGEGGLLGLAFHPNYASNGRFYTYHYEAGSPDHTVLAERHVSANPNQAASGETTLLTITERHANHNGGMLAFGPDGFLYVSVGDEGGGGDPEMNGQNIETLQGSLLRLDVNGPSLAPASNPFFGIAGRDEIWAYGLRNPWRFSFDRQTGNIFLADVGQNRYEEVDIIAKGGNYGWNTAEGTHCYPNDDGLCDMTGLMPPIHDYGRGLGRSVTGGFVYRGRNIPQLVGRYVFGDFISGNIWTLTQTSPGVWVRNDLFVPSGISVASFGEDVDGELFVVDLVGGSVFRIASDQVIDTDEDDDSIDDAVEDAAPNNGDANRDGILDSLQPQVVSFPNGQGDYFTLIGPANVDFEDVGFVPNPSPADTPAVAFPLGFLRFGVQGFAAGSTLTIHLLLPSSTGVNAYYRYGPTADQAQPHWYNFEFDGTTGTQIGTHSVTFLIRDGGRGDDDRFQNATIVDAGGPAADPGAPTVSYFPRVADGTQANLLFRTNASFVNTGSGTHLVLRFFQTDGTPMELDFGGELGRSSSFEIPLSSGQSFSATTTGAGNANDGSLLVGYGSVAAGSGVGGTLVYTRSEADSGIVLYEAGIPASPAIDSLTIPIDLTGNRLTGLALINPPESMPALEIPATIAHLTLRLYDADFTQVGQTAVALDDGQAVAQFPGEFFPQLPDEALQGLQGSLTVSADRPVSAVVLRQDDAGGLEFPAEVPTLTAFPVIAGRADLPAPMGLRAKARRLAGGAVLVEVDSPAREVTGELVLEVLGPGESPAEAETTLVRRFFVEARRSPGSFLLWADEIPAGSFHIRLRWSDGGDVADVEVGAFH